MNDPLEDLARSKRDSSRRGADNSASLPDASVFPFGLANYKPGTVPRAEAPPPAVTGMAPNLIFDTLVTGEADLVGFVAYGLYKHSKRDWLRAFEKEHGRQPNAAEIGSYIVGEGTERRLATYRHLAEETLAGRDMSGQRARSPVPGATAMAHSPASASEFAASPRRSSPIPGRTLQAPRRPSARSLVAYFVFLVLAAAGVLWVLHRGLPLGFGPT